MTLARKLERLVPALSVRERFLVALRQYKADEKITVNIADLSGARRKEYEHYARYVVALNNNLGAFAEMYAAQAAFLQNHVEGQIHALQDGASTLEEEHGIPREEITWKRLRSRSEVSVPTYLRGLAFQLQAKLLVEVDELWRSVRTIEIVWSEAEAELGEDPVHPKVRKGLALAKDAVAAARARLNGRKRPPEPGPELLENVRRHVREAARLQELQDDI